MYRTLALVCVQCVGVESGGHSGITLKPLAGSRTCLKGHNRKQKDDQKDDKSDNDGERDVRHDAPTILEHLFFLSNGGVKRKYTERRRSFGAFARSKEIYLDRLAECSHLHVKRIQCDGALVTRVAKHQ